MQLNLIMRKTVPAILQLYLILLLSCSEKQQNKNIKETNVSNEENYKVVFVELGSENCVPCKMMQPIMDDIKQEYAGKVKVVFHDVWTKQGRTYGEEYGIRAIPTQIFLDSNGIEYYRHEGFLPKKEVVKIIEKKISIRKF